VVLPHVELQQRPGVVARLARAFFVRY
jgi:hypothetical protein